MIETYKILTGKYDIETAPSLVGVCSSLNKRSQLEITKNRTKYDLCKFCFANRIMEFIADSGKEAIACARFLSMSTVRLETVRCWRPARNESTDGLARSESGSEFQSTMVRGKKE